VHQRRDKRYADPGSAARPRVAIRGRRSAASRRDGAFHSRCGIASVRIVNVRLATLLAPDAAFRRQDNLEDCAERFTGRRPYPAWAAMIEREIDRPIPIPSALVVNIESKMLSPASSPVPESSTAMRTPSSGACNLDRMINSRGRSCTSDIAWMAFMTRFSKTCCNCTEAGDRLEPRRAGRLPALCLSVARPIASGLGAQRPPYPAADECQPLLIPVAVRCSRRLARAIAVTNGGRPAPYSCLRPDA
jgi:hypothetical protein